MDLYSPLVVQMKRDFSKWLATFRNSICDYNYYGKIETLIRDMGGVVSETDFSENVSVTFRIEQDTRGAFDKKLKDMTNGKLDFTVIDEIVAAK